MTVLQIEALLRQQQPRGTKGLPPGAAGLRLDEIGAQGWNVLAGDLPLPVCVLRRSALEHNRVVMSRFVAEAGVKFAPHGKTTMAPQLFEQQLEGGAWGLTAATPAHLMAYRAAGVQRILYANQLVDPVGIAFVLDETTRDPSFSFLCLVDSAAGAQMLRDAVAERPTNARPIDVLIEIGMPGRLRAVPPGVWPIRGHARQARHFPRDPDAQAFVLGAPRRTPSSHARRQRKRYWPEPPARHHAHLGASASPSPTSAILSRSAARIPAPRSTNGKLSSSSMTTTPSSTRSRRVFEALCIMHDGAHVRGCRRPTDCGMRCARPERSFNRVLTGCALR